MWLVTALLIVSVWLVRFNGIVSLAEMCSGTKSILVTLPIEQCLLGGIARVLFNGGSLLCTGPMCFLVYNLLVSVIQ